MSLKFEIDGNLSIGIYKLTINEIIEYFGSGSPERIILTQRFSEIVNLAKSTGKVEEIFIWGSYITQKKSPKDIDLFLIMSADFDSEEIINEARILFDAELAQNFLSATILWITKRTDQETRNLILEQIQTKRDGNLRGIVKVIL